jgi:hypothetical protein
MYKHSYLHVKGHEIDDEASEEHEHLVRSSRDGKRLHYFSLILSWATTVVLSIACAFLLISNNHYQASCRNIRDEVSKDFGQPSASMTNLG